MSINNNKQNEGKEMKATDLATCFKQRHSRLSKQQ